jgi:cob(I)alamin adenosyltransferase
MVHVCYGDGPGKTTAAVGLVVRACGSGLRVLFAQFLKDGRSGELIALKKLGVDVLECIPCEKFFAFMSESEKANASAKQREAFFTAKHAALSGKYDLLVLDEVLDIVMLGIITPEELLGFLRERPETLEVSLTGHAVFPELIDAADYIAEVKKVKHPYDHGIKARRGVEL